MRFDLTSCFKSASVESDIAHVLNFNHIQFAFAATGIYISNQFEIHSNDCVKTFAGCN